MIYPGVLLNFKRLINNNRINKKGRGEGNIKPIKLNVNMFVLKIQKFEDKYLTVSEL